MTKTNYRPNSVHQLSFILQLKNEHNSITIPGEYWLKIVFHNYCLSLKTIVFETVVYYSKRGNHYDVFQFANIKYEHCHEQFCKLVTIQQVITIDYYYNLILPLFNILMWNHHLCKQGYFNHGEFEPFPVNVL